MACNNKSEIYNDIQELTDVRKSLEKRSPVFVPLNGLSQSAKDRLMNNRTVKPPKNINLIEGDPIENMDSSELRNHSFLNEYQLSSTIKEVNGMDYSNYCIEQHYRKMQCISPDISEQDSSNSLSVTNKSFLSNKCETGTCSSFLSNSTEAESSNTESDVLVDSQNNHPSEDDYSSHDINVEVKHNVIRRFSKNAAIMGLLRNKFISVSDLKEKDHHGIEFPSSAENEVTEDKNDNNNSGDFNSKTDKIVAYPHLVPHPEDPEFFTHPLQAYGKLDDDGIDFRVRSARDKTIITPRQHYIREGLHDDVFKFQTNKSNTASKPIPKCSFPSMTQRSPSPSTQNENPFSSRPSSSHNSSIDQDDDEFMYNRDDFPIL